MKKKWMPLAWLAIALTAAGAGTAQVWAAAGGKVVTRPFWICTDDQGRVTYARALHEGDPTDLEGRTAAALGHKTMAITKRDGLAVPFCQEETVHILNDEAAPETGNPSPQKKEN